MTTPTVASPVTHDPTVRKKPSRTRPEWTRISWEASRRNRVERALGLCHEILWEMLKHDAIDIVFTDGGEPFTERARFSRYTPECDRQPHTLMYFTVQTETYLTRLAPLLQEYVCVRELTEIPFRYHQTGFLGTFTGLRHPLILLNPYRETTIQYALDSRFLVVKDQGVQKLLRLCEDPKQTGYGWKVEGLNLDLDPDVWHLFFQVLQLDYTPTAYFFYLFDRYKDCPIVSQEEDWDRHISTLTMENGDVLTLQIRLNMAGKPLDHSHITLNGVALSQVVPPLNQIPLPCQETNHSEPSVWCVPDYYASYPDPYYHAQRLPLHLVEHLPIHKYDPPYVILDGGVLNTALGIYFS